jgi:hypothetical protein
MFRDLRRDVEKVRKEQGDKAAEDLQRKQFRTVMRPFVSAFLRMLGVLYTK